MNAFIFSGNTLRLEGLQLMCHLLPFHSLGRFHDDLKLVKVLPNIPLQPKIIICRKAYFEGIDLVMSTIKERFEQKEVQMLQNLERVLTIK